MGLTVNENLPHFANKVISFTSKCTLKKTVIMLWKYHEKIIILGKSLKNAYGGRYFSTLFYFHSPTKIINHKMSFWNSIFRKEIVPFFENKISKCYL